MRTENYDDESPRLTPPEVVYEHKAALKKTAVIPLYAKIASAAAAAALLLTLCWPRPNRPALELTAELKPIVSRQLSVESGTANPEGLTDRREVTLLSTKQSELKWNGVSSYRPKEGKVESEQRPVSHRGVRQPIQTHNAEKQRDLPLLASMTPTATPSAVTTAVSGRVAMSLTDGSGDACQLLQTTLADEALAWTPEGALVDEEAERGFLITTEGAFDSFGELLLQGWRSVKVELAQLNESVGAGFRLLKQMPAPPSFHAE